MDGWVDMPEGPHPPKCRGRRGTDAGRARSIANRLGNPMTESPIAAATPHSTTDDTVTSRPKRQPSAGAAEGQHCAVSRGILKTI